MANTDSPRVCVVGRWSASVIGSPAINGHVATDDAFASKLPACIVAMEACCGAHFVGTHGRAGVA
jgi:hypothetical protein